MKQNERKKAQLKLMTRYYDKILDPVEAREYRNKMLNVFVSFLGLAFTLPYLGHALLTFRKNPEIKRIRLFNGMIIQGFFTILNYRWSNQYNKLTETMQKKYLDNLPE